MAKLGAGAILSALYFLPLKAQQPLVLSTGQTLTATTVRGSTLLHLGHRGIALKCDNTLARPIPPPALRLIAELPGRAFLLTDTYSSRPASLSRCQAGQEQFLRVIGLGPAARETFRLKIASCLDTIELAEGGLQWSTASQTLVVHWLTPPAGRAGTLTFHIHSDGRVSHR